MMTGKEERKKGNWVFKVSWDFKMKREGSEGVLGSGNNLSNVWRQDSSCLVKEQRVLKLSYSRVGQQGQGGHTWGEA